MIAEKSQQSDVHDTYAYSKYCVKEEIVFGVSEPDERYSMVIFLAFAVP